jgi:hypothetical protein
MKTKTFFLLCLLLGFATSGAFGQEWTKAQKEVWQVVDDSWMKWTTGDIEAYTTFLHEKYQGWSKDSSLPMTKEMVKKSMQEMMKSSKLGYYEINPARITVTENAAVVDYFFYFKVTYTEAEVKELQEWYGTNVEFYVKEGDKWLLLGDFTISNKVQKNK